MLKMGVLGCGRIGRMHASNIARHPRASLTAVYDVYAPAANEVASAEGARVSKSPEALFSDPQIDAVLVATATETHADFIEMAVKHEKPILCEKPIDLSLARVNLCADRIKHSNVPIQLGFNRRFDPGHRAVRDALRAGEIGQLHQVIITSRDPGLPPRDYLESAGGLFRDMTIHDFDLARFMLEEEPVEVFAVAQALVDPALGAELDEIDTAMIIMRTASGKQCHINNSRAANYGYDQRIELLGDAGMLLSDNRKSHEMRRFGADHSESSAPYEFFFIERYTQAFMAEIDAFVDCVEKACPAEVGFEDGRKALILAEAAYLSLQTGRMVRVDEIV